MKKCKICNIDKSFDNFRVVRHNKNGTICYHARCNECYNSIYLKKYHNLTTEQKRKRREISINNFDFEYFKNGRLMRNYGISLNEFNDMYKNQNGKCFLCEKNIKGKEVKVDHSHNTGKVRKLLCHNCNTSLGLMKDNPDLFYKAAQYLKEHNDIIQKD